MLVKLAGASLVYQGIAGIYAAIVTWMSMGEQLDGLSGQGKSAVLLPLKVLFWSVLLPLGLGIRLLVSGTTLHGWLMMVPLGGGKFTEQSSGNRSLARKRLDDEEFAQFNTWLKANPEKMKRDEVDQLALFRDAQKAGEV